MKGIRRNVHVRLALSVTVGMAEEGCPPPVQKQASVDTYKWSNRKEDYELLDVIGKEFTCTRMG